MLIKELGSEPRGDFQTAGKRRQMATMAGLERV